MELAKAEAGYCDLCGGLHKAVECEGPHHSICFCIRCRGMDYKKWVSTQVENQIREEENKQMITVQRNNPTGNESVPKGVQFLSPRHVTTEGVVMKITRITTDKPDNFGNQYVVYFAENGNKYSKGYKPTSDALAMLVDLFGTDETKWPGQSVRIGKKVDDDGGERLTYSAIKATGKLR